jgi:hypothetical protein
MVNAVAIFCCLECILLLKVQFVKGQNRPRFLSCCANASMMKVCFSAYINVQRVQKLRSLYKKIGTKD